MHRKCNWLWVSIILVTALPPLAMAQDVQTGAQETGTYRWQEGCVQDGKVCGSIAIKNGLALLSMTVHGVRVDLVLADTGKLLLIAAAIGNGTKQPIFVLPEQFNLYDMGSKQRRLKILDPGTLARRKEKDALGDSQLIMTAVDLALSQIGTNTGLSALRPDSLRTESLNDPEGPVRQMALRADNIPSQKFVAGVVCFEGDKQVSQLLLSIPVGGYVIEFPFARQ